MIEKETVLILGAGASIGYGYPSGEQLKNKIIENLTFSESLISQLDKSGKQIYHARNITTPFERLCYLVYNKKFSIKDIQKFVHDFNTSPKYSIDSFLENRPEFLDIGKVAIAISIFECEQLDLLSKPNAAHWYGHLFNIITSNGWEQLRKNNIKIVTYNYDRSLEVFLVNSLIATFGKSDKECVDFVNSLKIVHVHGRLAEIPWEVLNVKPYNKGHLEPGFIDRGVNELRIIHEDSYEDKYKEIRNILSYAEQIFILGFGYDERNLERLKLDKYRAPIYSTSIGLSPAQKYSIEKITKKSVLFDLVQSNQDIVSFFKNSCSLEGYVSPNMPKKKSQGMRSVSIDT